MVMISNTSENRISTAKNSYHADTARKVARSSNYEIKEKQGEFE